MKIISKFKDFYDFSSPYIDNTNVWCRVKEGKTLDFNKNEISDIGTIHNELCKRQHLREDYWWHRGNGNNIRTCILGIYPKIYCIEVVYGGWGNEGRVPASEELHNRKEMERGLSMYSRLRIAYSYRKNGLYRILDHKDSGMEVDSKPLEWKDCGFFKIAPIFIYDFYTIDDCITRLNMVYNPCFKDLDRGLSGLINRVDELDPDWKITIYDRIENYLYSMKVEPVSEPDNKTKILNAGFDLKTSFRNM